MVADVPPAIVARAPAPYVAVLREGDAVPATALVDQSGRRFSFATTKGRTTIVSFLYTRCPDPQMCPLIVAKFARMQREVHGAPIRLVTISLDPAYDTPKVLARAATAYGTDPAVWSMVTGPAHTIEELIARLGIVVKRSPGGALVHTEAVVILDGRGRVARFIESARWLPDDVLGAAHQVAAIPGNPFDGVRLWLASSASALCGGRGATPLSVGGGLAILAAVTALLAAGFVRVFRTARTIEG